MKYGRGSNWPTLRPPSPTEKSTLKSPALLGLKKAKVKLDLLIDIEMLLMVEKCIRGRICHSIDMQKPITNTRKIMIEIKNRHIFNIEM